MQAFTLARRLLRRDWRSGELATLLFALVVAVTSVCAIALITDRLTQGMVRESAELIGGDIVVRSSRQPDPQWLEISDRLGLASARVHSFDSVLFHGDDMLLAGIKAVSDSYPLIGQLKISRTREGRPEAVDGGPPPGSAWVDARVLDRLRAQPGDEVHFGATTLRLDAILRYEPDQGNSLFQLAPRVLINEADLAPAEVVHPGSRIRYRYLFRGDNAAQLAAELKPLLGVGHQLVEPTGGETRASEALMRAIQYIKFTTLLAIVLAAIAIALAARRYSERHYDVSAMLRCLGARQGDVVRLYIYQLLLLTASAVVLGTILGWLLHWLVLAVIAPLLPVALPPPGLTPLAIGAGTALLLVAGFALPPVLRLGACPPLRALRRDLTPIPLSGWFLYGLAGASQLLLLWLLFGDVGRILLILLAAALGLFAVGCLIYLGLQRLRRGALARSALVGRSIRSLATHAATSTSQIMAFGVTLMILLLVAQLRTGLLDEWRLQLPENAPNYFAFNILPDEVEQFSQLLSQRAALQPLYPVVLARLTAANGEPLAASSETDTHRELNLTWASSLPADNEVIAGTWPPRDDGVSIEAEYAERLGVGLGDQLQFNGGGREFTATITSLRSVVWESFSPNFFLVFSAAHLSDMPATYLTSFHLDGDDNTLLRSLIETFPATTLIEVDAIIARLELVLSQVSLAVELMMVFVLLGGVAVLFATLQSTGDERRHEGALVRAMGASRHWLKRAYLMEFGAIGLLAGLLAVAGAEIASAVIHHQVFALKFTAQPLLWVSVPPASALLVATIGYLASRRILDVSPARVLSE
ncbi:MAG: FtsX-like permease family protein [Porticoccaceae bacterium]